MKALKIIVIFFFTIQISVNNFGALFMNDVINGLGGSEQDKSQVEYNIIMGASSFFDSYSNVVLLMKEYENYNKNFNMILIKTYTDQAILFLNDSIDKYTVSLNVSERIGNNENMSTRLDKFDYDTFIEKNNLNGCVGSRVRDSMISGGVIEVYRQNIMNLKSLQKLLSEVKSKIQIGKNPSINLLWILFDEYNKTALYGNYTTRIGQEIFK